MMALYLIKKKKNCAGSEGRFGYVSIYTKVVQFVWMMAVSVEKRAL